MKTKKIIIIFVCIMLVFFTLGMTEVLHMSNTKMDEENINDRLIGVFITTDYLDLFDAEGYFNDNPEKILTGGEINENMSNKYQGKLYATLVKNPTTGVDNSEIQMRQEYIFEGIEGITFLSALYTDDAGTYRGSSGGNAISDGKIAISSTDEGDSISLEGIIYASTTGGANSFYYNPVYQTGNGEVFTTSGQGMSFDGESNEGMSGSQTFTEETSTASDNETTTVSTYVSVTISFMDEPERVTLIQLDSESKVLSQEEYMPGKLPDRLTVDSGAEYIIVETESNGTDPNGNITRELYQPGDESLFAFYCREDGICVKQDCNITWDS